MPRPYSTVTLFARLRGWSTSVPFATLVPGARLVFTIEHPIYMAAAKPRW